MIFAVTHKYGTGKPIGSLQSFSDALARSIEASGEIHLALVILIGCKMLGYKSLR